ncbi:MAG: LD-carboxypeptidase [Desulfofustis sp.]|nr:LD-carboxypeptidase [Desulfofustis sp.]
MTGLLIPPALQAGDTVAVIAPAGGLVDPERYRNGCAVITGMGFTLAARDRLWPGYGYLADTDAGRAQEIHRVWHNPQVKAIIALRGGFDTLRLLDRLDFNLFHRHPKMLVGFSDISILLNQLFQRSGLLTLHGPVMTTLPQSDPDSLDRLYQCLTGNWHRSLHERVEIIRSGEPVEGPLRGGNLSSLTSLLGTPWSPDLAGTILFLEDVNEPPYRLDRALTHLAQSGQLQQAAGIILGDFSMDQDDDPIKRLARHEFVWSRVSELTHGLSIPIWGNFPIGHGRKNLTLPIGATALMDSRSGVLHLAGRPAFRPHRD